MRRLALLLLLLPAVEARADYKESFRKGIEAVDRKRWQDAARLMQEAIAGNPTEGERVKLYGLRFETYLPHFYLGAAYLNLNDCERALKAFETSRSQGAIRTHPKYAELVDGLKSCEGHGAKATAAPPVTAPPATRPAGPDPAALAQALQSADAALARAEEAARAVARLAGDPLLASVWSREASLGPAEAEAREALAAARARLDAGRRASDLALLAEAREQAARARERLDAVQHAAERRREALGRAQPPVTTPPLAPPQPGTRGALTHDLLSGAQAFFDGRYAEAIRALEGAAGLAPRAAAQAALLKAAAHFALFRQGGEKDAALRRLAVEAVSACRRADPSLSPDSASFSPQFLDFFRSNR